MLLQIYYSVRFERQLMEPTQYTFRFAGLLGCPRTMRRGCLVCSVKNRERLATYNLTRMRHWSKSSGRGGGHEGVKCTKIGTKKCQGKQKTEGIQNTKNQNHA